MVKSNDILNVGEAMQFLRIGKNTMYLYLKTNQIPARRIGKEYRLSRMALENWMQGQHDHQWSHRLNMLLAKIRSEAETKNIKPKDIVKAIQASRKASR